MKFLNSEFLEIARSLEKHHSLFYQMWNLGNANFSQEISTAAVMFDPAGNCINFVINPDFWEKQNFIQKQFVISHECLHVLLNHGFRISAAKNKMAAQYAVDIVVNHLLISSFGFDRAEIDPKNNYIWADTVFKDNQIASDKSFEYYYGLLIQMVENNTIPKDLVSIDSHEEMNSFPNFSEDSEALEEFSNKIFKSISDEEKEGLEKLLDKNSSAGNAAGGLSVILKINNVKPKKKWESVIKKWSKSILKEKEEEQWQLPSRRNSLLSKDLILPSETEIEFDKKNKIPVWFFQDTSGSCHSFKDRFFKAALSLPKDKFDIKMHCFDTRVYETDLKSQRLYGFGGTSFSCIDRYIERYMEINNISKYPTCMIITDGFGDYVSPSCPEKWLWFLSTNHRSCIPEKSKVYYLKEYE